MPTFSEDVNRKLNTGFQERLARTDPPTIDVLIQTDIGNAQEVAQRLPQVEGVRVNTGGIIASQYIPATIPEKQIPQVAKVDGVVKIHHDQPVAIQQLPVPRGDFPLITPEKDPIRNQISEWMFDAATPDDVWLGKVRIGEVVAPRFNFAQLPPGDPAHAALSVSDQLAGTNVTGQTFIPTGKSVAWVRNSDLTNGADGSNSKAAIIDTGHTPIEPANGGRIPRLESFVPGEPPLDFHGHGSWCSYTVAGQAAPSTWGTCRGAAPNAQYGHFKALNSFPGFGKTSWILRAMERANKWGADVISMSLGGTQQGSVDEDPYSQFISRFCKENMGDEEGSIFVVAAGNSGSDKWTIGTPGVAPKAVTVASWSLTDRAPAVWSSRGPQGKFYKDKPNKLNSDMQTHGALEFVKPDLAAPGGGRENSEKANKNDEYLHQSETGWMEGLFDGIRDTRGMMHGTSQATPHAAGEILRLYEAGIIKTAREVKQVMKGRQSVPKFPDAAPNANETVSGKNIAVGFGAFREAVFAALPEEASQTAETAVRQNR